MRRVIIYFSSILLVIGVLIIIYASGYFRFYSTSVNELNTLSSIKHNPCDTALINIESDYNAGIKISQDAIISNEQMAASNFQYYGNFFLIAIYSSIGFLIATYLSQYVSKKMPNKTDNEVKDSTD